MTIDPFRDGRCACVPVIDQMRAAIDGVELEPRCKLHEADAIAAWKAKKEQAAAVDHLARMEAIYDGMKPKEAAPEPRPSAVAGLMEAIAAPSPTVGPDGWPTADQLPASGVPLGSDRLNRQFAAKFPGAEQDLSTNTR